MLRVLLATIGFLVGAIIGAVIGADLGIVAVELGQLPEAGYSPTVLLLVGLAVGGGLGGLIGASLLGRVRRRRRLARR